MSSNGYSQLGFVNLVHLGNIFPRILFPIWFWIRVGRCGRGWCEIWKVEVRKLPLPPRCSGIQKSLQTVMGARVNTHLFLLSPIPHLGFIPDSRPKRNPSPPPDAGCVSAKAVTLRQQISVDFSRTWRSLSIAEHSWLSQVPTCPLILLFQDDWLMTMIT